MSTNMERLLLLRKELKMTQIEFAEVLGISQGAYSALESGRNTLTPRNAELLSIKLRVNKNWILTGEGEMFMNKDPRCVESMEDPKKQRIKELLNKYEMTVTDLSTKLRIPQPTLSRQINGDTKIQTDVIVEILANFPEISVEWLLSGEGSMLKEEPLPPVTTSIRNVIRYYNIDASAGNVEMFDDENSVEYEDLIIPGFSDCQKALNVWGDSMYPTLKSGEIVILKEWNESFIEYGKIFLIVTKNGNRMIKYLKPGRESGKLTCMSENAAHDPFEIQIEDIHKLFLVKGHIERCSI